MARGHRVSPEDKAFLADLPKDRLLSLHDEIHRIMVERGRAPKKAAGEDDRADLMRRLADR